jgi:hypothetical protein
MADDLYLFRFGFTWPEELAWVTAHPEADLGEASEAVFVRAPSREEAEAIGEELAEIFVRRLYGNRSYSWRELQFASWIEEDSEVIEWAATAHLLILESASQIDIVAAAMVERSNAPS